MIVLLDTSTPLCKVRLKIGQQIFESEWEAGRDLAHSLLGYLQAEIARRDASLNDILAIGIFRGPGSFTGLRIGMTVMNTIADTQNIPIVGGTGADWMEQALQRLTAGENDRMVVPEYGAAAHITKPRK